jgi:hypothetical protein
VTPDHPLFPWLVRHGASVKTLAAIAARAISLDLMGLNFYPQWSTQELYLDDVGCLAYRVTERNGAGFSELIDLYWQRYRVPIMVTETSAHGSDEVRSTWLRCSLATIKDMRGRGVPIVGYTWFPLMTMIDWRYRFGQRPLDAYRLELGLYRMRDGSSKSRWVSTRLVGQLRRAMCDPLTTVGSLTVERTAHRSEGGP